MALSFRSQQCLWVVIDINTLVLGIFAISIVLKIDSDVLSWNLIYILSACQVYVVRNTALIVVTLLIMVILDQSYFILGGDDSICMLLVGNANAAPSSSTIFLIANTASSLICM